MKMKRFLTVIFVLMLWLVAFSVSATTSTTSAAREGFIGASSAAEGSTMASTTALVMMAKKEMKTDTSETTAMSGASTSIMTAIIQKAPAAAMTATGVPTHGIVATGGEIIMTSTAAQMKENTQIVFSRMEGLTGQRSYSWRHEAASWTIGSPATTAGSVKIFGNVISAEISSVNPVLTSEVETVSTAEIIERSVVRCTSTAPVNSNVIFAISAQLIREVSLTSTAEISAKSVSVVGYHLAPAAVV